ncbi:MAG: transporter [Pyrinomonadaceae bacterium]
MKSILFKTCLLGLLQTVSALAFAQQPFVTDDSDVTPKGHFHFEFSNEFDFLQRASFPSRRQNTADVELDFGLLRGLELGVEFPLLTIVNAAGTGLQRQTGVGDTNLSMKYNFVREREQSRRPAMAIAFNLELPTGDTKKQFGSGLVDFYINSILQKSLRQRIKLRLNGGVLFSGNETTGVIGIKTRGTVFTGGGSLVKQITPKLDLGVELVGAITRNFDLGRGQLQTLMGGNYSLSDRAMFDFGIVAGKYAASPRVGFQLGLSVEW